jgi:DNA-directed RNA polymerase specialized sigma24 family protein
LLPVFDVDGGLEWAEFAAIETDGVAFDRAALLRSALECIDDHVRAAFVLRDLLQICAEEAAVVLHTTPKAIRRDVHRARLLLRGFVERL